MENKPKIFLVLRIIGFVLLAVGITLIIVGAVQKVPSMGEPGWFGGETAKHGMIFGGVACCMFSCPMIIISFTTHISKTMIKTSRYIQEENKQDLTDLASTNADIVGDSITKTVRSIRKGFKDEKFCKYCGSQIDEDSKFCSQCGARLNDNQTNS